MDKLYCRILVWSIMRLVNRQKTYQTRCERLNTIIKYLVDVYSNYSRSYTTMTYNEIITKFAETI